MDLALSAAAGLGIGTLLNSWINRRWEIQRETSGAIAHFVGQLVGIVGSAKDQIAENDRIIAKVASGELAQDRAHAKLSDDVMGVSALVMGAQIISHSGPVDIERFVVALDDYQAAATAIMEQQRQRLQANDVNETTYSAALRKKFRDTESELIRAASLFIMRIKRAKF